MQSAKNEDTAAALDQQTPRMLLNAKMPENQNEAIQKEALAAAG